MSNIRDVSENRIVRELVFVFDQLVELGVKRQTAYPYPAIYGRKPLTKEERRLIRNQLRRDLKASLKLVQSSNGKTKEDSIP